MSFHHVDKDVILLFCDYFLPGYKAGGPIRTLANLITRMGQEFQFEVITRDRDMGDSVPFAGISPSGDRFGENTRVKYLKPSQQNLIGMLSVLRQAAPKVVYFNSLFSVNFSIVPLTLIWLRIVPSFHVLIAPRGELSSGALALKSTKKKLYLKLAKFLGFYQDVYWQASTEFEEADIRRCFGPGAQVIIAPDLVSLDPDVDTFPREISSSGKLKIIFLARISKIKNLDFALRRLRSLNGEVIFNIYGPLEDSAYWKECQILIEQLPSNVSVFYNGAILPDEVADTIKKHDLLFLPTKGENFGHVILEALRAGCPVLISDQTPWRNLADLSIGWDFPINQTEKFESILQHYLNLDEKGKRSLADNARKYGFSQSLNASGIEQNRRLFNSVLKPSHSEGLI